MLLFKWIWFELRVKSQTPTSRNLMAVWNPRSWSSCTVLPRAGNRLWSVLWWSTTLDRTSRPCRDPSLSDLPKSRGSLWSRRTTISPRSSILPRSRTSCSLSSVSNPFPNIYTSISLSYWPFNASRSLSFIKQIPFPCTSYCKYFQIHTSKD